MTGVRPVTRRGTALASKTRAPASQPQKDSMLQSVVSAKHSARHEAPLAARPGVAVLLNANAKAVNARVRQALSLVVPDEHLFFSTSHEEASAIAEEVVARRYGTVF